GDVEAAGRPRTRAREVLQGEARGRAVVRDLDVVVALPDRAALELDDPRGRGLRGRVVRGREQDHERGQERASTRERCGTVDMPAAHGAVSFVGCTAWRAIGAPPPVYPRSARCAH